MILEESVPEHGLYTEGDLDDFVERLTCFDLEWDEEGDARRAEVKAALKDMPFGIEQVIEGKRVLRLESIKKLGGRN